LGEGGGASAGEKQSGTGEEGFVGVGGVVGCAGLGFNSWKGRLGPNSRLKMST